MRRGRARIAIFAIAGLGLAAAYSGYWHWLSGQLQAGLVDWIDARRAEGFRIDYGAMAREGFPFEAAIVMSRPAVARAHDRLAWQWRGESVRLALPVYRFDRLVVTAPDPNGIAIRDGGREVSIDVQALHATLDFALATLTAVKVDARQVVASSSTATPLHLRRLVFTARPGPAGQEGTPARPFSLRAEDMSDAALGASALGARVDLVELAGDLRGRLADVPPRRAARDWRDEGGVLDVSHMRVVWGPVRAVATGTLTLDTALRPFGVFAVRLAGYDKAIDALVAQRQIDPGDAGLLKSFLGVLAAQKGDRDGVPLPVHIQNGRVWLGPKAVADVGPLF